MSHCHSYYSTYYDDWLEYESFIDQPIFGKYISRVTLIILRTKSMLALILDK